MLEKMESGDDPQIFLDQQLTTYEQRWSDLVTQGSGAIDALESAVNMVSFSKLKVGNNIPYLLD